MLWLRDVGECVRAAEVTKAKQERRVSEPGRNLSYGDYILRTGRGIIGAFELVFGAFLYQKFKGRSRIVDVGPGRCWFPKQNPQGIIAVDNSPELVEYFSKQGIDIRLGDAYNLPLPDAYADGVLYCWVLEHLADPLRAMKETYRVMQPGAYGMIIVPTPYDMNAFHEDYTHVRPYTATSLKQLAEDAGFVRHRETLLPYYPGATKVLKYFGPSVTLWYMNFGDRFLRKLGLKNNNNIMLEVWKS
jgi:SAM-dependent methyltransferase